MRTRRIGPLELTGSALVVMLVFVTLLPWSAQIRHEIKRVVRKTEIRLSGMRGKPAQLINVSGRVDMAGAEVQAIDSRSGWATLCDADGRFTLPDVQWYPGAGYDLLVSADYDKGRLATVSGPLIPPARGVIYAGDLNLAGGDVKLAKVPGASAITKEQYDYKNRDYYRTLFDRLTAGIVKDPERIDAVNRFLAGKLDYKETQWDLGSPRRVIEHGSEYCGHLASAMAALLAVGYEVRIVHLMDKTIPPNTHAVVEVRYHGTWHLYDPTFGVKFVNDRGEVASYKEVRLNPGLVRLSLFSKSTLR
jgi:transglutaminase-like putative cysteine protease